MTVNEKVAMIRKATELSMDKFGARIGVSKNAINSIEKGVNNPSTQTLKLICKEFNVNEDFMFGDEEEKIFNPTIEYDMLINSIGKGWNDVERDIVKMYIDNQEVREAFATIIKKALESIKK